MTRDPKHPGLADVEVRRPRSWNGGSQTTAAKERRIAANRRRAKIASLVLARKATP